MCCLELCPSAFCSELIAVVFSIFGYFLSMIMVLTAAVGVMIGLFNFSTSERVGHLFTSERGTPFTPDALNRQIKHIGATCCGTPAATSSPMTATIRGPSKTISATSRSSIPVRYTELSPVRFKGFFAN